MIFGLEPYVDRVDEHRRFLESINPTSGFRLFIKRSVTEEESKSARNKAGTSDNWSQRSYSSLRNEAYAISFVRKHTSIPVPTVFTCFEDRGCFYLVQEYAEGCISATHAAPHLHQHIARQLAKCVQELHDIRSHKLTCFVPEIHLPARMQTTRTYLSSLTYPEDPKRRYVLCHGDLGWQNVMVDPDTGYIKAVIDWEYAGFFPVEVEGTYWQRWGIAAPIGSEISDADHITALLQTLSSTRAFPKGYKVKSFKIAMDSDQGSPLRDVTEVSPNPQSKITRLLTRIFRKKHEAKSEAASNAQPKDSTGDTQNLRLPESTQKIPTDPNLSAAETGVYEGPSQIVEKASKREPPYVESSDLKEWSELEVHLPVGTVFNRTMAMMVDHHALHDWAKAMQGLGLDILANNKYHPLAEETEHLVELSGFIAKHLSELGHSLKLSAEPISYFQSRQLLKIDVNKRMDEMKPSLPDDCDVPDDALQEYIALGWKSLLINRSLHMDRDEAFHKSETAKWDAIGKYGEKLVVASHAAKQLLPFTPNRESNQPRRRKNPARGEADDRVRDLLMGGTGGWISKVLDDEDWTPIDHRKYGVPDEGESESDSESIKQKLKESWDKMIEERDARLKGTAIFKHASEGEKLDGTDLYLASWAMV